MSAKNSDQAALDAVAWDRFLDDLLDEPDSTPPPDLAAADAALLRATVALERGDTTPNPARQERVWSRALAGARDERIKPRRLVLPRSAPSRVLLIRIASVAAAVLLVAATTLWLSPGARAGVAQLACLVPGIGIRDCAAASLVAAEPVSVTRGGATFTVLAILSADGRTIVRAQVTGLPTPPPGAASPAGQMNLALSDAAGREYQRVGKGGVGGIYPRATSDGSFGVDAEGIFAALRPETRTVDVVLTAPDTVGNWHLQVPVVPVDEAALPVAQPGGAGVTLHGVTVRVTSVAADRRGLAVQLLAQTDSADRLVRGDLGGMRYGRKLVLRDHLGRSWIELPPAYRQDQVRSGSVADEALFAPLPADVTRAALTIPFVTVEEAGGSATLRVPLAGRQVGEQFAAAGDFDLGGFRVRVTNITLAEDNKGNRRLWFDLAGSEWADGRKFVEPGGVALDGVDRGCGASYRGDVSQMVRLCVSLPPDYGDEVTVTLRNPVVAIAGPWELAVPLPARR